MKMNYNSKGNLCKGKTMENTNKDVLNNDESVKPKKYHFHFKKKYQIRLLVIIGIILIGSYLIGCFYYQDRFLPNTTLSNISISHLTYQEASQKISKLMSNQTLTLIFSDQQKETIQKKECGITFNQGNDFKQLIQKQNPYLWFTHLFSHQTLTSQNLLSIDKDKLKNSLNQLEHLKQKQIEPVDAKVEYKDQQFTITKETYGTKINQDVLIDEIIKAFYSDKKELNIQGVGGYVEPKMTSDNESLKNLLDAAKKYCQASITYKTTTDDVILDGNTLMTWLSIDENGHYYKDDNEFKKQATEFVKELSQKVNIIGKAKTITGANNRKVTVTGGNYGYKLNQEKEVTGLIKDINDGKQGVRTPITTGVQSSYDNGGVGQTFVEIDMTKQHFWLHKNGRIVLESDVVTGLPSNPNRKTPEGVYYIYFMQRNRTLRGEIQANGKPEYETPVAYWMAFNGGIGLHDASWQSKFGGNVYYTKGSHGCINLPKSVAAALYDMIKVNTPVVCYY